MVSSAQPPLARGVLTTLSADHEGVTREITAVVAAYRGNIIQMFATKADDVYSSVFVIEAAELALQVFEAEIEHELGDHKPTFRRSTQPVNRYLAQRVYDLSVAAADKEGIIFGNADVLTRFGVNVLKVAACRYDSAPFSGERTFMLDMKLDIPQTVPLDDLVMQLRKLADENGWDTRLRGAQHFSDYIEERQAAPFPPSSAQERRKAFRVVKDGKAAS